MGYCDFCKKTLSTDAKFCKHCGNKMTPPDKDNNVADGEEGEGDQSADDRLEKLEAKHDLTTDGESSEVPTSSSVSKRKKWYILSTVALFVLLIGAYFIGNYMTSAQHALEEFKEAIEDEDYERLESMLTAKDKDVTINEESVKSFVKLFTSKPSELNFLMTHLKQQAQNGGDNYMMAPVDLVKDGKQLLVFDDYQFQINPVYFNVSTNYKDTDIIINDEVVATSDSEYFEMEIGPLIPGEHTIKAVYDTGFFNLDTEETVTNSDPSYAQYVDLYLSGDQVGFNLFSNRYDELKSIQLYVNGKDTGWDLIKDDLVGPLLIDGTMNAAFEAEFPWGTMKTNEIPIDQSYMEFNFGDNDEFKEEIMDVIITFNEQFMETYTTGDPAILTTASGLFVETILSDIAYNITEGIEYQGAFHGVDFYNGSFILEKTYDDIWVTTVDTVTYYEEAFFAEDYEQPLEKIEEELRYELGYDQHYDEWIIVSLDFAGTMDEDNMERFIVDEPVFHSSNWADLVDLEDED